MNLMEDIFNIALFHRGGLRFPPNKAELLQWLTGEVYLNPNTQAWEFLDSMGKSDRPQQEGRAYKFDGIGSYIVALGVSGIYNGSPSGKVYLEFKPLSTSVNQVLYGEKIGTSFYMILRFNGDIGCINLRILNDSGNVMKDLNSNTNGITLGEKHTLEFTDNNGTVSMIIDGVEDTANFNYTPSGTFTQSDIYISKLPTSNLWYFDGIIGNISIYDINNKLLHKWNCSEQAGNKMLDSVGGLHGTIQNFDPVLFHIPDNSFDSELNNYGYSIQDDNHTLPNYEDGVFYPIKLDQDGKSTGLDIYGNTPTYTGRVKYNTKAVESNCIEFDGVDDEIILDEGVAFGELNFSVSCWFYYIFTGGSQGLIGGEINAFAIQIGSSKSISIIQSGKAVVYTSTNLVIEGYNLIQYERNFNGVSKFTINGIEELITDNVDYQGDTKSIGSRLGSTFFKGKMFKTEINDHKYNFATGNGNTIYDKNPNNPINGTIQNANLATFYTTGNGRPHNYLDGYSQGLYCSSSGTVYKESKKAYGLVADFIANKAGYRWQNFFITPNTTTSVDAVKYDIRYKENDTLELIRFNDGSATSLFVTVAAYIHKNTNYRFLVWRNSIDGVFSVYIQGRDGYPITDDIFTSPDLAKMELVEANTGQNPTTAQPLGTTSTYNLLDLDAGDQISNLRTDEGVIDLHTFTVGTGAYDKLYIPAQTGDTGVGVNGAALTNPSGKWHNGSETTMTEYKSPAMLNADKPQEYLFNASEIPQNIAYSDLVYDVQDKHITFCDVSVENEYKNRLTYETAQSDQTPINILKYVNAIQRLVSADGYTLVSNDGYTLYARRS